VNDRMVTMLAASMWRHWIASGYALSYTIAIPRANRSPAYKEHLTGGEDPDPPGGVDTKLENVELSQTQTQTVEKSTQELEEELKEKGRIGLIEVETQGKKYFKPNEDFMYRLAFDRRAALEVRAKPSTKLTKKIPDRNDPSKIIGEQPVMEWIWEITHISGNTQLWSITSKKLATKIIKQLIDGKSVIDFMKSRTGPNPTDVEYTVIGVR
jgi:hypothetical protein